MIKDCLVVLDDAGERAAPYGLSLAAAFRLSVSALVMSPEETFETLALADVRYDLVAACRDRTAERASLVRDRFAAQARGIGLEVDAHTACGLAPEVEETLLAAARLSDLVVIEQGDPATRKIADRYIERLLLGAGRPVLVVPYIQDKPARFGTVTVAWDGSATAARALADSIPFLRAADHVEVVSVGRPDMEAGIPGEERILRHLARHGVDARCRVLPSDIAVADTLLDHAADRGSDLLVMGVYGHSRLREAMLGGASRTILRTMTLPVLMSH